MLGIQALAVVLALVAGLIVMFWLAKFDRTEAHRITAAEFVAVAILMILGITPLVSAAGSALSVSQQLTRYQWVNGTEEKVNDHVETCKVPDPSSFASMNDRYSGDTNCKYYYDSGREFKWEEEDCTTDSEGKTKCETDTHRDPIYYPYATVEHTYSIDSSMGKGGRMSFTFPNVYLDANPVAPAGTGNPRIPDHIPRGAPADWLEAKARKDAGDPRSVTKLVKYEDYILASGDDTLTQYSSRIDELKKAGLLPEHTADITSDPVKGASKSQADKVRFVGVKADEAAWQKSVMRFNSALGMKLQGDLHVVLIDESKVDSPVQYIEALKAYWQSEAFGKRTIAKNGIILVLGVDTGTNTISWAEASTGMPFGNEEMLQYLRDKLRSEPLNPDRLFGKPVTVVTGDDSTVTPSNPRGVVEQVIFETKPFKRASMTCKSESCVGFESLVEKIQPSAGAKAGIVIVTFLLALGLWAFVGFTDYVGDLLKRMFYHKQDRATGTRPSVYRPNRKDHWR